MSCWIAIPIKEARACKTRLRAILDDRERENFARSMLRHVSSVADRVKSDETLMLLAPGGHSMPSHFEYIPDRGKGLNGELAGLLAKAAASEVDRLVIIPADLPLIADEDIGALTALPEGHAAIAPDRAELGTNALSLPLPATRDFRFQFGPMSFAHHCGEAERLSLPLTILRSAGLAFDVDEPADLADLWQQKPDFFGRRGRQPEVGGAFEPK